MIAWIFSSGEISTRGRERKRRKAEGCHASSRRSKDEISSSDRKNALHTHTLVSGPDGGGGGFPRVERGLAKTSQPNPFSFARLPPLDFPSFFSFSFVVALWLENKKLEREKIVLFEVAEVLV